MDQQLFDLIEKALSMAGNGGETAAYLVVGYLGIGLLKLLATLLFLYTIIKMILKTGFLISRSYSTLKVWRDRLGIGRPGALVASELSKVITKIDSLIAEDILSNKENKE